MGQAFDPVLFGERLQQLMDDVGISHRTLADAVGVARPTVSNWAKGRRTPNMEQFHAICSYFQVPAAHFFDEPAAVVRFDDPELHLIWRDAPKAVREDVGSFLRFLSQQHAQKEKEDEG